MWIKRSMHFFTEIYLNPWAKTILLVRFYRAILAGWIILYENSDFSMPSFIKAKIGK